MIVYEHIYIYIYIYYRDSLLQALARKGYFC